MQCNVETKIFSSPLPTKTLLCFLQIFFDYYKWWTQVVFLQRGAGLLLGKFNQRLVYDLYFKNRIKKIKYLDKVKKDPIKMLKIYKTLNTDVKTIYNHNSYKRCGRASILLAEEKVTVVNIGMSSLRTSLKKCLMKTFVGFINFSDDF